MTGAERRELTIQLERIPSFVLRMMIRHPNMVSEYAANELQVRRIKNETTTNPGWSVKV